MQTGYVLLATIAVPLFAALALVLVPSRYPNGLPSGYPHQFYGREMAQQALQAAEGILTIVQEHYQAQGDTAILGPDREERTSGAE